MVDTFMSRDSDSPIIQREKDAVIEWLASDKVFHIMRDHHAHCTSILAGMWGAKISQHRSEIAAASYKILKRNHRMEYDYDQLLLSKYMWPIAIKNMMAHDSYCCKRFPHVKPFPTKRIGVLFIGSRGLPGEGLKFVCPKKCRPLNATSPEWKFC
ncbi:uncharacterized protein LOC130702814 [Daphnia carinata]|uniref:uncharacterized protein LOC130702814 n=1 Tax=Daphnia carinata TaxID=120202 RepID=UPI0028686868|nr:uncharacterized protein LOC130702814 [Daphnia carinata]